MKRREIYLTSCSWSTSFRGRQEEGNVLFSNLRPFCHSRLPVLDPDFFRPFRKCRFEVATMSDLLVTLAAHVRLEVASGRSGFETIPQRSKNPDRQYIF